VKRTFVPFSCSKHCGKPEIVSSILDNSHLIFSNLFNPFGPHCGPGFDSVSNRNLLEGE
jgi:hypothetical protein